jgi:hypothetical protein
MKITQLILGIITTFVLAACGSTEPVTETPTPAPTPAPTTPTDPSPTDPNPTDPTPTPQTILTGTLSGESQGMLEVTETGTQRTLGLSSDFKANGTDNVALWLAKDTTGTDSIELPDLKTEGAQTFTIPEGTDLNIYKFVVVWCADVSEVIGSAELSAANTPPTPPTPPTPATPETLFTGTFSGDSKGTFEIVQTGSERVIKLSDTFDANGTSSVDLWLAKDSNGAAYVKLENFQLTGSQTLTIPATVDFAVYTHVIVWCADVSTIIGRAELMIAN